jgi:hypothetical protein
VAIIEGFNHSSSWSKPRNYKEITLLRQWEDKLEQLEEKRYLLAEKYPYLSLRFDDTYI